MSLETPPLVTVPPVPKPRTLPPGRGAERKPAPDDAPAGATPPLVGVPPLVPQVPPRRKKSAPAAFHLQVLQTHSQLLQDLARSGLRSDGPPAHQPDGGAQTDGHKEPRPEAASLLGDGQDPFWSLLQHPNLVNSAWLSKSSDPLDAGTRNLKRAHTAPLQVSGSAVEEPPPEHMHQDLGHWAAISDTDKRTVLQVFDPLAET